MAAHVRIITRPANSDGPGRHVVIDHDDREHRQWLAKHCWWAARSGHVVTSIPTDDAVTYKAAKAEGAA